MEEKQRILLVDDNRCPTWKEDMIIDGHEQVSAPRGVHHD